MKKILLLLVACSFANISNAQVSGGFVGPEGNAAKVISIQEALNLSDDSRVSLEGKIVNSLGDEKYTFKDATGEIIIEIDDEDWNGNKVTPEDTIVINGEVDKDVNETTKIDVDTFTIKN